jgi:CHAD domain-containing protein
MKKKTERKYLAKEWRSIKSHLEFFVKKGEQEDLHRFRTGVKKLRAFLILADSATKEPDLEKRFKPVHKVFKQAGEIRNAYVNQELGKAQPVDFACLMRDQRLLMKRATKAFNVHRGQYLARLRKTRRKLSKRIVPVSNLHIRFYYQQQIEAIAAILARHRFDEELHACRKQLKILIYNYQLVRPELDMPFNEDYLEKVQNAIGDWHDNLLAIALFSKAETGNGEALNSIKKQGTQIKRALTQLTKGFQEQATTVTALPLEQID